MPTTRDAIATVPQSRRAPVPVTSRTTGPVVLGDLLRELYRADCGHLVLDGDAVLAGSGMTIEHVCPACAVA